MTTQDPGVHPPPHQDQQDGAYGGLAEGPYSGPPGGSYGGSQGGSYGGPQGGSYGGPPRPGVFRPPPAVPTLPRTAYSPWGRRVLASLIDSAPSLVGLLVYSVGYAVSAVRQVTVGLGSGAVPTLGDVINPAMIIGLVIVLAAVPWTIWNRWVVGGKTGQSLGKRVLGSTLRSEQTGAPVGAGMAFLRDLVHTLDGAAYIGYLWPLWDEKRQTFADKLMQTVVLPVAGPDAASPSGPPSWGPSPDHGGS